MTNETSAADGARPGSIGAVLPRDLPIGQFVDFAQSAESLGFDELWVVEDCFFRGGIAQAATALATTSSIRVGIGILPAAVRNPAFTALETATLAELHPGRIELGIGHGMPAWMRQVGAWPASPVTLLEETLGAVRSILHGERVDVDGRYVSLSDVRLETTLSSVPPVYAGVRGPKSLAVAGRAADGTILAEPATPEYVRAAVESIGATGSHRIVGFNVAAVADDIAAARVLARPSLQWVGEPDGAVHLTSLPFADELAELRAACATREEFTERMPDEWVDALAIVGSPVAALARIREIHDAGAGSVVLLPAGPDPLASLRELGEILSLRGA